MSLPLIDARLKITAITKCVLETQHELTGKDESELMRDVLHKWAEKEAIALSLLRDKMRDKGILGDYEGVVGK